jgi:carboxylesterase type B
LATVFLVLRNQGGECFERAVLGSAVLSPRGVGVERGVFRTSKACPNEAKLGAHSLAELRALPAARVIAAGPAFSIIDGYVRPEQTYAVFAAGTQNDVPLLVGHTSGEGDMTANVGSAQQYVRAVREQAGPLADRLRALFPAHTQAEAAKSQRRFETEYSFAWEAWTWGRLQSRTARARFSRWQPVDESHQRVMHMGDSFAMSDLPDRPELEVMDDFVRRLRALDAGAASVR